jgi:hypothetical protein
VRCILHNPRLKTQKLTKRRAKRTKGINKSKLTP